MNLDVEKIYKRLKDDHGLEMSQPKTTNRGTVDTRKLVNISISETEKDEKEPKAPSHFSSLKKNFDEAENFQSKNSHGQLPKPRQNVIDVNSEYITSIKPITTQADIWYRKKGAVIEWPGGIQVPQNI